MEIIVKSTRNGLDELYHSGSVCVVDKNKEIIYSLGDYNQKLYLRSTSKAIQILPLLYYDIDKKYNISLEELAIMVSSHTGSKRHIEVIDQIMAKTNIKDSDFCIKPAYPTDFEMTKYMIENNLEKQAKYHMCSGKHLGLMLIEKEFNNGNYTSYFKEDSKVSQLCKNFIARVAEVDQKDIAIGMDGCGVIVFAISLYHSALAFMNMANPNFEDQKLNECIKRISQAMNMYPDLVRGKGYFCSIHNEDKNVIAKDGAHGFYAFGLKNEKIGAAFKNFSGDMNLFGLITNRIYEIIDYDNSKIKEHLNYNFTNDNDEIIGKTEVMF